LLAGWRSSRRGRKCRAEKSPGTIGAILPVRRSRHFDDYSIAWVNDINSRIDVVNGFIEVYLDAIGKKGSFESVVSLKDLEATKRIKAIADQAQWFEDHFTADGRT
jgi:hypothetical protein